jgi:hypothetical protein
MFLGRVDCKQVIREQGNVCVREALAETETECKERSVRVWEARPLGIPMW